MSEGGLAGTAFVDLEPRFGAGFGAGLASKLKTLAAPAAVVGIGAGLFSIGEKFEKTFNSIKVQTGATGGVFDKLKQDTKNVLSGTAGSFDQVSAAISGLYQRTGLTGKGLDDLAKKQVTLARITKTDVAGNVEQSTALFNRYGLAVGDQSSALDVLFKASQQSGKGITDLISNMQKGAPALQAFGFGFDKSAALVAGLERAGVNIAPVLTGLRTAFGKIAKEGGDPQKVLAGVFKELKDGKDTTKATADAIKLFGARGGKELSDAVRQGRFDVDGLLKTITNGKDGINATGTAVSTIGGKLAKLKNKALVALEPIATAFVSIATEGVGKLLDGLYSLGPVVSDAFSKVRAGFAGFGAAAGSSGITKVFVGIGQAARDLVDQLQPIAARAREVFTNVKTAIAGIDFGKVFATVRDALTPIIADIAKVDFAGIFGKVAAIITPSIAPLRELATNVAELAVAALPVLKHTLEDLKPVFIALVAGAYILARVTGVVLAAALKVTAAATGLLAHHASILRPVLIALVAGFVALKVVRGVQAAIRGVTSAVTNGISAFSKLAGRVGDYASSIKNGITATAGFIKSVALGAVNLARQTAAFIAQKAAALGAAVAQKAMAAAQWLLNAAMDANPIGLIVAGIAALAAGVIIAYKNFAPFRNVVDATGRAFAALAGIIVGAVGKAVGFVRTHWPLLLAILTGPIGVAALVISKNWDKIKAGASAAFEGIKAFFTRLPGVILSTLTKAPAWLLATGGQIIGGLAKGIATNAFRVFNFFLGFEAKLVSKVLGGAKDALGWLYGIGSDIVEGMLNGLKAGWDKLTGWISDAASHLPGFLKGPLHIKSPSRVFAAIGEDVLAGFNVGLEAHLPKVKSKLGHVAGEVVDAFGNPRLGAPKVNPVRFATPFVPGAPAPTDVALSRARASLAGGGGGAPTGAQHVTQENHFHRGDVPSIAELDYSNRKLAFALANTGRRP